MKSFFRPRFALLGLFLSLVSALLIVSCRDTRTTEEKVYDAFVLLHTDPDGWNERIAKISSLAGPEAFTQLNATRDRIDVARRSYLRSCNVLSDPGSSACRTLAELNEVLQTLNIAEQGLKSGKGLEGTLEGAVLGGLARKKSEERGDVAIRVKPYFFEASSGGASDS